jgi:hypothetical protein
MKHTHTKPGLWETAVVRNEAIYTPEKHVYFSDKETGIVPFIRGLGTWP